LIFGFNTDVKFADTVYHVQSEALPHELVLQTLVFLKGRCIGKRTNSYAEQTKEPGFSEEYMHEMLKDQHKHFVAAVREGRIEAELGEHSEQAHAEELPPAAAALLAEFAVVNGAASGSDSQLEEPAAVIVEPEEIEEPAAVIVEPEKMEEAAAVTVEPEKTEEPAAAIVEPEEIPEAVAAAPDTVRMDDLAVRFAAAVASKPVDPGLSLVPAGKMIGKGISLECRPPTAGADEGAVTIGVEIGDENGPAAGAQVSCRITSGKTHASYIYATTNAEGVADVHLTLQELDLTATALLIQASHRGQSASRKFKLQTSS
jgi:hypothetical protein